MKLKTICLAALYAALAGAGMGLSTAQTIPDYRCQQCQWNFQAGLHSCDLSGGEDSCYAACINKRRLCVQTFCP